MEYKFYVTDWAPNGTNGLIIRDAKTERQIDYRDDALFGVDVNKLGPAKCFETDFYCPEYRIPQRLLRKHIATSPILGTFEDNCKWLSKYLSKQGAK